MYTDSNIGAFDLTNIYYLYDYFTKGLEVLKFSSSYLLLGESGNSIFDTYIVRFSISA